MAHVCPIFSEKMKFNDNFTNESIYETIKEVALQLKDSVTRMGTHFGKDKNYFTLVLTEEGFCFTFNALNSHDMYTNE